MPTLGVFAAIIDKSGRILFQVSVPQGASGRRPFQNRH